MKMTKQEKRGLSYLTRPPKKRKYKRPVKAYVHYICQGGDMVCFAVECSSPASLQSKTPWADIVPYKVSTQIAHGARLIKLPSEGTCV